MVCLRIANAFSWTVLLKKMFESDKRVRVQPAETQSSGTGPRSLGGRHCVRLRAGSQLRQEGPIRAPLARKTCRCAAPRRLWRRADCRGPNLPLLVTSLVGVAMSREPRKEGEPGFAAFVLVSAISQQEPSARPRARLSADLASGAELRFEKLEVGMWGGNLISSIPSVRMRARQQEGRGSHGWPRGPALDAVRVHGDRVMHAAAASADVPASCPARRRESRNFEAPARVLAHLDNGAPAALKLQFRMPTFIVKKRTARPRLRFVRRFC
jgi:hypothetical protein